MIKIDVIYALVSILKMNNNKKGNQAEKQAKEILESWGYCCIRSTRTSKMIITNAQKKLFISLDNDFFGLFDLIAKNKIETRYIQVKSHSSDVYKNKHDIATFNDKVCNSMDSVEIWLRMARKGFRIYKYLLNNKWVYTEINFKGKEI